MCTVMMTTISEVYCFYVTIFFDDDSMSVYEQTPFGDRSYMRTVTNQMSINETWFNVDWNIIKTHFENRKPIWTNR